MSFGKLNFFVISMLILFLWGARNLPNNVSFWKYCLEDFSSFYTHTAEFVEMT